ncbi:hypothetical protein HN419_03545 [Candidatus Woesearchaeota archaeon]|nr:hypothetical protein [Candidatus Woesearchaeota archaeon]MBT3538048.1 hypothetical protein [Candidatus Woesearchaeota archaeon]MBT4697132.1 hypothetical protein [Candidatus Woesearchaeota archaeon]MBT4717123.1 hypothetical protein [Candidatus Woesearchaeota archaeon]MBT7105717.1 hypothetical protein [Candidatus Woesearchaeota archaeon]
MWGKKGKFKWFLAGEIVAELFEAGLTLLTVSLGLKYYQMKTNYFEVLALMFNKLGIGGASAESSAMVDTIGSSFPFNYLYSFNPNTAILIGAVVAIIGLVLTVLTTKHFKEFVRELGKGMMVPGVVGLVSVIILTLANASVLQTIITKSQFSATAEAVALTEIGVLTWQTMGILFIIGIYAVICGLLIQYVVKTLGAKRHLILYFVGNALFALGIFSFAYYFLVRILGLQFIADTLYGASLIKYFVMSWYISRVSFIVCLVLFFVGWSIFKVSKKMPKRPVVEHWLLDYFLGHYPRRAQPHPHYQQRQHPHQNLRPVHPYSYQRSYSHYPHHQKRK